jgi:hypothetical protein
MFFLSQYLGRERVQTIRKLFSSHLKKRKKRQVHEKERGSAKADLIPFGRVPPPISSSFGFSWKTMLPNNSEDWRRDREPPNNNSSPVNRSGDREVEEDDGIGIKCPKNRQKLSLEEYSEEFITTEYERIFRTQISTSWCCICAKCSGYPLQRILWNYFNGKIIRFASRRE